MRFEHEEADLDVRSIAVPVRDFSGKVIAAVGIVAPSHRLTEERLEKGGICSPWCRTQARPSPRRWDSSCRPGRNKYIVPDRERIGQVQDFIDTPVQAVLLSRRW